MLGTSSGRSSGRLAMPGDADMGLSRWLLVGSVAGKARSAVDLPARRMEHTKSPCKRQGAKKALGALPAAMFSSDSVCTLLLL